MADGVPRSRWRTLFRRVFFPGALLGIAVVSAGNVYVVRTALRDMVLGAVLAPARPVAIVLGTTVDAGGHLSSSLAARTDAALQLYRLGKVQRILVSGAYNPEVGYDEPGSMAAWLERRGVPGTAILLDREGHRTAATMANAAARGFRDVLICTQEYHLPRSLYFARHAGISAKGVPAEDRGSSLYHFVRARVREWLARAEAIVEVAARGVTAR